MDRAWGTHDWVKSPWVDYGCRYRRRFRWVAAVTYVLSLVGAYQNGSLGLLMVMLLVLSSLVLAALLTLLVALFPPYGSSVRQAIASAGTPEQAPPHVESGHPLSTSEVVPAASGPKRFHRAVWSAIAVLMLAVVVVGADMVQANREMAELVSAARAYQDAERTQNTWAEQNMPDAINFKTDPDGSRSDAADGCAHMAGSLSGVRGVIEDVSILPWHSSLRQAKAAMVRYASARVDYLDACASAFTSVDGSNTALTKYEAEGQASYARLPEAFADAEPLVTLPWLHDDVASPFTE